MLLLNNKIIKKGICVTESLKPYLDLKGLCILRQWAGVYDEGKEIPNISTTNIRGFIQANRFGKFGMCLAPAAALEVVKLIKKH